MKTTYLVRACAALLLAASGLSAQDLAFEAGFGLASGHPSLTKVTNRAAGALLSVGLTAPLSGENRGRLALNVLHFPGATANGLKSALTDLQLLAEVSYPTAFEKLEGTLGLTFNRWTVKNTGIEVIGTPVLAGGQNRPMPVAVFALKDPKGVKLGLRAGFQWRFSPRLQGFAAFQMAEAGGGVAVAPAKQADGTFDAGYANRGPVNPSWLEVGLRWRF